MRVPAQIAQIRTVGDGAARSTLAAHSGYARGCHRLVAPRNRASAPSPRSVAREHQPTSSSFPH